MNLYVNISNVQKINNNKIRQIIGRVDYVICIVGAKM